MSKIFKRPMFRKGGSTNEMNGIMTGIVDRENYNVGSAKEILLAEYEKYPDKSMDPLAQLLIEGGLNLTSATPRGGLLATAAESFKEPTSNLFKNLSEINKEKRKIGLQGTILDIETDNALKTLGIEGKIKTDVAKISAKTILDSKKEYLDNIYAIKKMEAGGNQELLEKIEQEYQRDLDLFIIKGLDVSDIYNVIKNDEIQSVLLSQAENYLTNNLNMNQDDPKYPATLLSIMAQLTKTYGEKLKEGFASGGRVKFAMGTPENMNQNVSKPPINVGSKTITSNPQIDITYEELRSRLPEQISDEIVKLLSTSYEALADFAELRTQSDVNSFNSRYGVNLILPQEA